MARKVMVVENMIYVIFFEVISIWSSDYLLNIGHVIISQNCTNITTTDELTDWKSDLNNLEKSVVFKETCLDAQNFLLGSSVCSFMETEKISALVISKYCYPQCDLIASIASQLGIPMVQTDPYICQSSLLLDYPPFILYPEEELLEAIESLLVARKIDNAVLLYDPLTRNDLELTLAENLNIQIISAELPLLIGLDDKERYTSRIKELLVDIRSLSVTTIILHSSSDKLLDILDTALYLGMLNKNYSWIITNLETFYQDINNYIMSEVTFIVVKYRSDMDSEGVKTPLLGYEDLHINDSLLVLIDATLQFEQNNPNISLAENNILCNGTKNNAWPAGIDIQNLVEGSMVLTGQTGKISFNDRRHREASSFNILQLNGEEFELVGNWSADKGYEDLSKSADVGLLEPSLRIATRLKAPFVDLSTDEEKTGNEQFHGFLSDLLKLLSSRLNFTYEMYIVEDGFYGVQNESGSWDGLIGELIDDKADIALADLTVTAARSEVLNFTTPFLITGLNFIIRQSDEGLSGLAFLYPLSTNVWISIAGVFIGVSVLVIIISYITPYNRELYKYGSIPAGNKRRRVFRVIEDSFWFAYVALVHQRSDFNPRSLSIRLVVGTWWLFAFLTLAVYTANLTAFLTVERFNAPINSIEELLKQNEISYGVVNKGATFDFLRRSNIEPFKSIWKNIDLNQSWLVDSLEEGINRACNESYAFFGETIANNYYINNLEECKLTSIGGHSIGDAVLALAFQKGDLRRDIFSTAILEIKEEGIMDELKETWNLFYFEDSQSSIPLETSVLGIENLIGMYEFLVCGCVLGLLLSFAERIWYNKYDSSKNKNVEIVEKDETIDEIKSDDNKKMKEEEMGETNQSINEINCNLPIN